MKFLLTLIQIDSHDPCYFLCIQYRKGSPFTSSLHHKDDNRNPTYSLLPSTPQAPPSNFAFLQDEVFNPRWGVVLLFALTKGCPRSGRCQTLAFWNGSKNPGEKRDVREEWEPGNVHKWLVKFWKNFKAFGKIGFPMWPSLWLHAPSNHSSHVLCTSQNFYSGHYCTQDYHVCSGTRFINWIANLNNIKATKVVFVFKWPCKSCNCGCCSMIFFMKQRTTLFGIKSFKVTAWSQRDLI